jgi:hypothetical protein
MTQVRDEREKVAEAKWERRDVLHTFDDGWTIELLDTTTDRKTESDLVFQGRACITGGEWDKWLGNGSHLLLSLRDPEGNPKATLLFGEAGFILEARAGHGYVPYAGCKAFDQQPRCLNGKPIIALQCCPPGYMAGDTGERLDETKRVKAWFEALPLAEEFQGWRCNDADTRTAAQEFVKLRAYTKEA